MSFQLLRLLPDPNRLSTWATRHGALSPDGDFGYALHALLSAAFGDLAPKPFSYQGGRQGLLAYTSATQASLRLNAQLAAPDVALALGLDDLQARPFPTDWQTGQCLGFEVRVRPVVRTGEGRERDAFLHSIDVNNDDAHSAPSSEHSALALRTAVYAEWLTKQLSLNDAAQITEAHLESFRLTRVLRKEGRGEDGKRKATNNSGPDAVFKGQLQVGNGEAFASLLARGVGRHRAFGFGMLLLRPARSC